MSHLCTACDKEFPTSEALSQHRAFKHPDAAHTARKPNYLLWAIVGIAVIAFLWWSFGSLLTPGQYDDFAQCITDSGAKLYGAFWCPRCNEQKELFGTSAKYLPYIECSTPDGNSQLPVCATAGIEGYPTWVFTDGSRGNVMGLAELSQKTGCSIS